VDTSFVVFNISPPRIVVQELTLDLTCAEPCFQASSAQECLFHVKRAGEDRAQEHQALSLFGAVEILCNKGLNDATTAMFARMSVLNIFSILSDECHYSLQTGQAV
jgi:hypothetical protein